MHELSLAKNILDAALGQAGSRRITLIRVKERESGHPMEPSALEGLIKTIAKSTAAEGAEVRVEMEPPTLRCAKCGKYRTERNP